MSSYNIITELSERALQSLRETLQHEDRLTQAMREALSYGAEIDEISELTGLTPSEIRRRVERESLALVG